MAVKALTLCIAALLLVCCLEVKVIGGYNCMRNQLAYCDSSPRLNISKSNHFYYLTIPMCSNDKCAAANVPEIVNVIEWVDCSRICDDCNKVLMSAGVEQDCGENNRECELTIDSILNSFCKNITLVTPTYTTVPFIALNQSSQTTAKTLSIITTVCPTPSQFKTIQYKVATFTTTVSPSCPQSAMPVERPTSLSSSSEKSTNSETALGVLLALSVVLLAVVTTGWVCTSIIMKKRMTELNDNNRSINVQQLFPNPAYAVIHTLTCETEPTYDYANLPSQSIAI